MIEYRNLSDELRQVNFGVPSGGKRLIEPDGLLSVVDEAADAFDCQPSLWQPVDSAAAADRAAARVPAVESPDRLPAPELAVLAAREAEARAAEERAAAALAAAEPAPAEPAPTEPPA